MREVSRSNPARALTEADGLPDAPGYREALDYAAETFKLIQEYKAPPIPKAYEVLYSYVSSDRDAVKIRVDEAVERHGVLNLYDIDQIHSDYFSYTEAMQAKQSETVGSMDVELDNLLSIIEEQSDNTSVYSRSLDMARGSLAQGGSPDHLRAAVQLLLSETQRVSEQNREMVEQLEASQDAIRNMKDTLATAAEEGLRDALTGLKNRRHFDRVLPEEIENAQDSGMPLALCVLDIDNFSEVNDTFGHPTGDAVLRLIGSLLSDNLKGRDTSVRYGGEEFAMILPMTDLLAAQRLADRIRKQIREKRLVLTQNRESLGMITVSFGVAEWISGENAMQLAARADAMLYKAKSSGRDRVVADTRNMPDSSGVRPD